MSKEPTSGPRLRLNPIRCDAHGLCLQALPEMLKPDPWGYPVLTDVPVPPRLLAHARRAAAVCPTLALKLDSPAGSAS
jgi:ferredoxin